MDRPLKVGITQGDINGVSYEIILKALGEEGVTDLFTPVVFGHSAIAELAKEKFDLPNLKINVISSASEAKNRVVNLVELSEISPMVTEGKGTKESGESAVLSLERAVEALKNGEVDVLVTAPISKEAVQSETFKFPGHTEYLTEKIGEGNEAMMILCNEHLRVALLTMHVPITKVAENITEDKIIEAAKTFADVLKKDFGVVRPHIAILSLNPHAGDGGVIGHEEEEIMKPSIEKLKDSGILAFGPFPADGFFGHGSYKKFDGVLAMYHDQGLAPFKTISAAGGVNFSANLPFVRTSPDHGTAFDIAWKGVADPASMREAIYMAIDIFRRRSIFEEAAANPLKKHVHERPEREERFERQPFKSETNHEHND